MTYHLMKLFKLSDNQKADTADYPVYLLEDGNLYRTVFHPRGWSQYPDYTFRENGKFYRTGYHELGGAEEPDYEFGPDMKIYRTENHPAGGKKIPEYEIRE